MPTIKAGTYTFKETPNLIDAPFEYDELNSSYKLIAIPVRCTFPYTANSVDYEITASSLYLYKYLSSDEGGVYRHSILGVVESVTPSDKENSVDDYVQLYNDLSTVLWRTGSQTINVLEDADADETAYNWFTANIEGAPTSITYNGTEIASLESGQTATLSCNGKLMQGDVVIAFGSDGTITYDGTVTNVSAGKTATLSCSGKVMNGDIVISL